MLAQGQGNVQTASEEAKEFRNCLNAKVKSFRPKVAAKAKAASVPYIGPKSLPSFAHVEQ